MAKDKEKFKGYIAKEDKTYHLAGEKRKLKKGEKIGNFELNFMSDYAIECWFCAPDSKEGKLISAEKEVKEDKEKPVKKASEKSEK